MTAVRQARDLSVVKEPLDVTHLEIYERLLAVEQKVDNIETNTAGMVAAFNAAQGAFTVLEWLAKAAKPILYIGGLGAAFLAAWEHIKSK